MYCKNCGKEVNDNAVVCIHCGAAIAKEKGYDCSNLTGESKTGMGVLLGIFLGIIGLIIGLCLYPANSEERRTFLKGWGITFAISIVISIILYASIYSCVIAGISYYY